MILLVLIPLCVNAVEYHCSVKDKYNFQKVYTKEEIKKWNFTVRIEETGNNAYVYRCSYSIITSKETCDKYEMDRIEYDENIKAKKYYLFRSQFNVQLFSDLSFVEDNGRGGIAYGICKIVSP